MIEKIVLYGTSEVLFKHVYQRDMRSVYTIGISSNYVLKKLSSEK